MSDQEDIQDRIERYALGEMEAVEAEEFARALAADPELRTALEAWQALRTDLSLADEAAFLDRMQTWATEFREEDSSAGSPPAELPGPTKIRRPVRWPYAVAAVILLLLVPTVLLLRSGGDGDQALFREYFQPYPDVTTGRSSEDPDYLAAMAAYNADDHAAAAPRFTTFLKRSPGDQDGLFYGALSELTAGDPLIAAGRLADLRTRETIYRTAATWYEALARLKAGERPRARDLLEELAESENSYREQAKELLGRL